MCGLCLYAVILRMCIYHNGLNIQYTLCMHCQVCQKVPILTCIDTIESVSVTEIPSHLEAMVELLCLEDSQKDSRDQGTMV